MKDNILEIGDVVQSEETFGNKSEYIVIEKKLEGGGFAHNTEYPDGWNITFRKLKKGNKLGKKEKQFYQTGNFVNELMLKDFILIREMEVKKEVIYTIK